MGYPFLPEFIRHYFIPLVLFISLLEEERQTDIKGDEASGGINLSLPSLSHSCSFREFSNICI
jgi:hypothetical protein